MDSETPENQEEPRKNQGGRSFFNMSLTLPTGAQSLLSLGLSLVDIAIVYKQGRKVGNWFRAKVNDEELLQSIGELSSALFKRKGVVLTTRMRSLWPNIDVIYEGQRHGASLQNLQSKASDDQDLSEFSWLMVCTNAALTHLLSDAQITAMWTDVYAASLAWEGDEDGSDDSGLKASLRAQLPVNLES